MSVRATERLIGDVVIVTAFPKSPQMVVQAIDGEVHPLFHIILTYSYKNLCIIILKIWIINY